MGPRIKSRILIKVQRIIRIIFKVSTAFFILSLLHIVEIRGATMKVGEILIGLDNLDPLDLGSYPPISLKVENHPLKVIETMKQLIQVNLKIPRRQ